MRFHGAAKLRARGAANGLFALRVGVETACGGIAALEPQAQTGRFCAIPTTGYRCTTR